MIPLSLVIGVGLAGTAVATWLAVRAVSPRRRMENRRTHRLGAFLSCSPSLWRGPRRWNDGHGCRDPLLDGIRES